MLKKISYFLIFILITFISCEMNNNNVFVKDETPPAEITNIKLTYNESSVDLDWKRPLDDDFLGIELSINPTTNSLKYPIILKKNTTNYTITELTSNKEYEITIKSIDTNLNYSNGMTYKISFPAKMPHEVSQFSTTFEESNLLLNWKYPISNNLIGSELSITPTTNSFKYPIILKKNINSYSINDMLPNTEYTITIKTIDTNLNYSKGVSQKVSFNAIIPQDVTDLTAKFQESNLILNWKNPTDNNFIGTELKISPVVDSLLHPIILKKNITNYTIANLPPNEQYIVTIKTIDKNLNYSNGITENVFLDKKAPSEVTNLTAITGDKNITLNWIPPTDEDLSKIKIYLNNKVFQSVSFDNKTVKIPGLVNGTKYTFIIKTEDKNGNMSKGIEISQYPMNSLSENITKYDTLTINTNNKPTTYDLVRFGDWPQTIKPESTVLSNETIIVNNWICHYGSDGYYYTKCKADPLQSKHFSNGIEIIKGSDYFFRLEPLKWRVLTDNYNGKKLLLAENSLTTSPVYNSIEDAFNISNRTINNKVIYANNYKYSIIRSFLNGLNGTSYNVQDFSNKGFLQKAFTKAAIEKIEDTLVKNDETTLSDSSNTITPATSYICEDTIDKIFLLSQNEITNLDYGFTETNNDDANRRKLPTDYAIANRAYTNVPTTWWWLRTPNHESTSSVYHVAELGKSNYRFPSYTKDGGIVPALCLK